MIINFRHFALIAPRVCICLSIMWLSAAGLEKTVTAAGQAGPTADGSESVRYGLESVPGSSIDLTDTSSAVQGVPGAVFDPKTAEDSSRTEQHSGKSASPAPPPVFEHPDPIPTTTPAKEERDTSIKKASEKAVETVPLKGPSGAGDQNSRDLLERATQLEKSGSLESALELVEKVVNGMAVHGDRKLSASALAVASRISHRLGKDNEALDHVNRAIELNLALKNAGARSLNHIQAARILMSQSNFAAALDSLQEALRILPASESAEIPIALDLAATCQLRLLRHSDAIKTLSRVLTIYSKEGRQSETALVNLRIGELQMSRSAYRSAREHFRNAEKIYRDRRDLAGLRDSLYRVAYAEQSLGDYKNSQKALSEAQSLKVPEAAADNSPFNLMVKGISANQVGHTVQATRLLTQALSEYETAGEGLMASHVRLALAHVEMDRSRFKPALDLAGKALEGFRSHSVSGAEIDTLLVVGEIYFRQGYVQKGLEYAKESSSLARKSNDRNRTVEAGILLADIRSALGDTEGASKLLKESIEESRTGISLKTRANLRLALCRFKLSRDSLEKALGDATEARKEFKEILDRRGIADSNQLLGLTYELQGDRSKALTYLQKAVEDYRSMGDRLGEGRCLTALGVHYKNQGDHDKAMQYFSESLDIRKGIGDRRGIAANLSNIGNMLRLRNQINEAQSNLEEALKIFRELSDKKGEADSLANLGQVEVARGMQTAAQERFAEALKLHREIKDNRGIATDLTGLGRIYLARGNLDYAASALEEAARVNKLTRNPKGDVAILSELAMLQRAKNKPTEALSLLKQALDLARRGGDSRAVFSINLRMASVLEDAGEYNKALDLLKQTLAGMRQQGDRLGELWALGGMGIIQAKTEDYENALQNLSEALRLRTELGLTAQPLREMDFHLGEIHEGFRDFERALEHYHKALALSQTSGNEAILGKIYDRIGNIYFSMEEYARAKDFLEDALRVSTETRNVALQKSQLIRLGDISSKLGDAEAALKYQQRALALNRETRDDQTEARILTRIGTLNQVLGRPKVAVEHYMEAKEIRTRLGDRRGVNENLLQIALLTSTLGDSDAAVEDLKKALEIAQSSEDRGMLWKAYFIMGRTLEAKKSPGEALESYRRAIAVLETMEAETIEESDEDDFIFGGKTALYETTLRVLMSLARKDPAGAYDNQALKIVEKLKAASFEKTLSAINVETFSDLPGELLIREKSLKLSLRRLNARLEEERSKINRNQARIQKLLQERRAKEKSFKELQEKLATEYPAYSDLRYPRGITVHQLQKEVIDPDEAVIEYMVTRSKTYVFALDKQRFHTFSIDYSGKDVEKDVDTLTRPLHKADTQASWDPSVAYRIYSKIIKPVEYILLGKKTAVIIPHGPLCSLPFEILVDSKSHAGRRFWSANDRPSYLLERYAFCYSPSASILAQVRTRTRDRKPGWNLVAFGDADYTDAQKNRPPNPGSERLMSLVNAAAGDSRGQDLRPLPGARKEISEIVRIVGGPTQTYTGSQATETLFKKVDLARYAYIHLATHGVLLTGAGRLQQRPAIVFSLYGDKENDGFLQLGEVFGLRLNADLVVLSSCLTPGKTDLGDSGSLTGLARAFLFAGTDAVIMSMWQVNDESTARLFIEMYRNLSEGSKAEALREAKLTLLKNSATSHPYYWGPFVLVGDWRVKMKPSANRADQETIYLKGQSLLRRLLRL